MIAMIPWALFVFAVAIEYFAKEWKREAEYREVRRRIHLEYECQYPDDPCLTDDPQIGVECDNCCHFGLSKEPK
jgi:hypothetical protein